MVRSFILGLLSTALFIASSGASAASVKSMMRHAGGITDEGRAYEVHVVVCSDGVQVPITYWKGQKQWCLGEVSSEQCSKKKISTAIKACKTR